MAFIAVFISSIMFGIARLFKCSQAYYDYVCFDCNYPTGSKQ